MKKIALEVGGYILVAAWVWCWIEFNAERTAKHVVRELKEEGVI